MRHWQEILHLMSRNKVDITKNNMAVKVTQTIFKLDIRIFMNHTVNKGLIIKPLASV